MNDQNLKYYWVETHKELAQYLNGMESRQKELVELLKETGVTGLHDEREKGKRMELEVIDPFSFFCFIHKYGDAKRLKILQKISNKLGLTEPRGVAGIPSTNPMMVMMFFYARERNDDDIQNLWRLFHQVQNNSISDDLFQKVLKQNGVGKVKITETLFYVDPENYFPINGPTKAYLKKVLGIDPKYSTWQDYLEILNKVKEKTDKPFYEISHKSWLWLEEKKKQDKKYATFQELVDRYKRFLKEEGIDNERYKWEAIYHFQQVFNIEAENFADNFKEAISRAVNLVYQNSIGFIRKAADYYPEDVRGMFRNLYNESQPLTKRFEDFVKASEELLPKVIEKHGKELNHQQDERTLSYYLTMRYPEKYPLYKNETYKYLLSVLDLQDAKPAGKKFFHYLEMADDLIPVIESDGEAIDMVVDQLTEKCYRGEQQALIFQDILWLNKKSRDSEIATNYWLFQGNPKIYCNTPQK